MKPNPSQGCLQALMLPRGDSISKNTKDWRRCPGDHSMEQTDLALPLTQPQQVISSGHGPKGQNEESNLICLSLCLNEIKILKNTGWACNSFPSTCFPGKGMGEKNRHFPTSCLLPGKKKKFQRVVLSPKVACTSKQQDRAGKHFQKKAAAR